METFSEKTQHLLKQLKEVQLFVYKVLQIFLLLTAAILLVLITQQFLRDSTAKKVNEQENVQNKVSLRSYNSREKLSKNYYLMEEDNNPVVTISNGNVRGVILTSRSGRNYSAFYGMPYAESPTGVYRFQPPRPYKTEWEKTWDGTVRGNSDTQCLQSRGFTVTGVEDCLKVSVFSPMLPSGEKPSPNLAVMFYILGGGFKSGQSNKYGADYMMDEDVVLVLVDFRLGAFGHLSTEDEEIRGNMAFKDQVMALKWVQANIEKFGGDPNRVLVFGNSSGAACVHALVMSKMSAGLFHRAVSQSGSVLRAPGQVIRPLATAKKLGQLLNCSNVDNTSALHECIINADPKMVARLYSPLPGSYVFVKEVIPKNGDESEVFFPDLPGVLLRSGDFNKNVTWLVGVNSAESFPSALRLLGNKKSLIQLNTFWDREAPLQFKFENARRQNASAALKAFYFGGEDVSNKTRYPLTDCMSDISFVRPIVQSINFHAKFGGTAYQYWLTHEPIQSMGESSKRGFPPPYGVAHADELQFFFPFEPFHYIEENHPDFKFSIAIIKIWVNFARTGIPQVPGGEIWLPVERTSTSESSWMELNNKQCQLSNPLKERLEFLDSFPLLDANYAYPVDSE